MKYETSLHISYGVIALGLIMAAVGGYAKNYYSKKIAEQNPPLTKEDIEKAVSSKLKPQLDEFFQRFKLPDEEITEKYDGLSMHMILSIHEISEDRRKYIFDSGNTNKNRISVYLDPSNIFTFLLIDSKGESHSLRVPIGSKGVPLEEFIYLTFGVGMDRDTTILRVFVNAQQVGELKLPFKVNINNFILPPGSVFGANLNGELGASFHVASIAGYSKTLTTSEIKKMLGYFQSRNSTKLVFFRVKDWMRRDITGSLSQPTPGIQPKYIDLESPDATSTEN